MPPKRVEMREAHTRIVELDKEYRKLAVQRKDPKLSRVETQAVVAEMKANREQRHQEVVDLFGTHVTTSEPVITNRAVAVSSATAAKISYGEGRQFLIRAPQGWALDKESDANGLPVVFYPVGSSWGRADAVMFANGLEKAGSGAKTLSEFIDGDKAEAARRDEGLVNRERPILFTGDRKPATVVEYESASRHEWIAYLEEKQSFVTLVASAHSGVALALIQPVFAQLVASYRTQGDVAHE